MLWGVALLGLACAIAWGYKAEVMQRDAARRAAAMQESAARFQMHGIDVSAHQGKIQWKQVADATLHQRPISFVFIKCSEGATLQDRQYITNLREARKNGLMVGAYHYYKPGRDIDQQARNFIKNSHLQAGDLVPVLDVEEAGRMGRQALANDILRWMKVVGDHYKCVPILYAGHSFRRKYLNDARLKDIPLWKAHYQKDSRVNGRGWTFFQYTERGHVQGIRGYVDLNVFHGSPEDLQSLAIN